MLASGENALMSRTVTLTVDIDEPLFDALQSAVSEGEASSVAELVSGIVAEWCEAPRTQGVDVEAWVRRGVEESVADPHPGFSVDDAFTQARDRLFKPQSKAS